MASSSIWHLPLLHAPTSEAFLSRFCPRGTYQGHTVDAQESFYQDAAKSWHRALVSIGLTLIALVTLYAWQRKRIGPRLVGKYPILFCALVGIVLTWTVSSFVLWNLEGSVNEDFTSIGNSSLYLVDYLTPYFWKRGAHAQWPDDRHDRSGDPHGFISRRAVAFSEAGAAKSILESPCLLDEGRTDMRPVTLLVSLRNVALESMPPVIDRISSDAGQENYYFDLPTKWEAALF